MPPTIYDEFNLRQIANSGAGLERFQAERFALANQHLLREQRVAEEIRAEAARQRAAEAGYAFTSGENAKGRDAARDLQTEREKADSDRQLANLREAAKLSLEGHEKQKLLAKRELAREYGAKLPDTATLDEINDAIQKQAGMALEVTHGQMQKLEGEFASDSNIDAKKVDALIKARMANDPSLTKFLTPGLREQLANNKITLEGLAIELKKDRGWFGTGTRGSSPESRMDAFSTALANAKTAMAQSELENEKRDTTKSPKHFANVRQYLELQDLAKKHMAVLNNPEYLSKALSMFNKQPPGSPGDSGASVGRGSTTAAGGKPPLPPDYNPPIQQVIQPTMPVEFMTPSMPYYPPAKAVSPSSPSPQVPQQFSYDPAFYFQPQGTIGELPGVDSQYYGTGGSFAPAPQQPMYDPNMFFAPQRTIDQLPGYPRRQPRAVITTPMYVPY